MQDQKRRKISPALYSTQSNSSVEEPAIFKLNEDCMRHIFSYLSIQERIRVQRVCKRWQLWSKFPWTDKKKLYMQGEKYPSVNNKEIIMYTLPVIKQVLGLCGSTLIDIKVDHFEENFPFRILTLIHKYCPNLLKLDVNGLILTYAATEYLSNNFKNLTEFVAGEFRPHCEDALLRFFKSSTQLRSVTLFMSDNLPGSCLEALPESIEQLSILTCKKFKVENVKNGLQRCKNLRSLSIDDNILILLNIDEMLDVLPNKLNLTELFLDTLEYSYSYYLVRQINSLHHFTNLQKISLSGNPILFDEVLTTLGKYCVHLTHAYLSKSSRATDSGWQNFVKLLNLEVLVVSNLYSLSVAFLSYIRKSSLRSLRCANVPVTNGSIRSLMQTSENLKVLEIYDCKNVDTIELEKDALNSTHHRPHNNILKLYYGPHERNYEERIISSRLIVKKIENSLFLKFSRN